MIDSNGTEYEYEPYETPGNIAYQVEVPADPRAALNPEYRIIITDERPEQDPTEVTIPLRDFQVIAKDVERIATERGGDAGLRLDGTKRDTLIELLEQAEDESGDWRAAIGMALDLVRDA